MTHRLARPPLRCRNLFGACPCGDAYKKLSRNMPDEAAPGLLLVEIVLTRCAAILPPIAIGLTWRNWLASRFRPIRTTNIDVFTKMLEPDPARERNW